MTFDPTKNQTLRNVIAQNVIWSNQKTESFVYRWLSAHAVIDVTCVPAFVGASDVISGVMSISSFYYPQST